MEKTQGSLFGDEEPPWVQDSAEDICLGQVVFAEAPYGPFDYKVPDDLRHAVVPGVRVRVPLGRGSRAVTGYCVNVGQPSSKSAASSKSYLSQAGGRRLKAIHEVMDAAPLLPADLLRIAEWISTYYLTPMGTVIEAMVPAAVREQSGTREQTFLSVPNHVVARMTALKLPPKQHRALKILAASPEPMTPAELALQAECTTAPIQSLRRKGFLHETRERVSVHEAEIESDADGRGVQLNEQQSAALQRIETAIHAEQPHTILLHGITGSGKTEVYIRAIEEVIRFGRQAIVLVPEISLTPQTRSRFRERFRRVAVLHSHLTPPERNHQWKKIASGEVQVIVGARSAVFAPAPNLGLIILDEEHDSSFKQDKAPRYHAREVALERSRQLGIPTVLGSATPSLESWHAAKTQRWELLSLPHRVLNLPLPDVRIVDLRVEFRQRSSRGMISRPMHAAIQDALTGGGQVILLLNRRGFAKHIQCPACGTTVQCPNCAISLTHHRERSIAICHYCDYRRPSPTVCPDCDFEGIRFAGYGTQRLEEEVASRFAAARVLRMDSDAMQRHGSHEAALESFRQGEVDILLGTQMIAKGLDFPNVTLVGVVSADTSLHFPDFRAGEQTFSLVTQVAGRSGRGEKGGRVIVQTLSPEHMAIMCAAEHDFPTFAAAELENRDAFGYSPFCKMARLVFRSESEAKAKHFAESAIARIHDVDQSSLASGSTAMEEPDDPSAKDGVPSNPQARKVTDPIRICGPLEAPIHRLRNRFRFHAILFHESGGRIQQVLRTATQQFPTSREVEWIVDVDPIDML